VAFDQAGRMSNVTTIRLGSNPSKHRLTFVFAAVAAFLETVCCQR
jgi:hypothetical protein